MRLGAVTAYRYTSMSLLSNFKKVDANSTFTLVHGNQNNCYADELEKGSTSLIFDQTSRTDQ